MIFNKGNRKAIRMAWIVVSLLVVVSMILLYLAPLFS
jgi:hypothetical protein